MVAGDSLSDRGLHHEAMAAESSAPQGDRTVAGRRHIVVFKRGTGNVARTARQVAAMGGARLVWVYDAVIGGFAAVFPSQSAISAVAANPLVDFVEEDSPTHGGTLQVSLPSWGLDRIDQRSLPLEGFYSYVRDGSGVTVYVVDTGLNMSHWDFGGRAAADFDYDPNNPNGMGADCNGHGTFVGGIAGGALFGVAKGVALRSVRVLGCTNTGLVSDMIAGINWVALHHQPPSVANFSITSDAPSPSLDMAISNLVTFGVPAVVIAGNGTANDGIATDACNISPARVKSAFTVGSTDSQDAKASTSNYGTCVDLFAPGDAVQSDCLDSNVPACPGSGTSFAAPHVAGAIALYLAQKPLATPGQIVSAFTNSATKGKLTNVGAGSPNSLLSTLFLARGVWTQAAPLVAPSYGSGASVLLNGTLYHIGNSYNQTFAPALNYWDLAQSPPIPLCYHSPAAINGKIYVHGNACAGGDSALYSYDPATDLWSQRAAAPVQQYSGAMVAISGKLYLLAGFNPGGTNLGSLYRYDPTTNSWTQLANAPHPHAAAAYGVINGKLYIAGGVGSSGYSDKLDVYDPGTNSWTTKASMPTGRGYAAYGVVGSKLVVLGGILGTGNMAASIESYDATTDVWTYHPPLPSPLRNASGAFIGNLFFLVGGCYTSCLNSTQYVTVF